MASMKRRHVTLHAVLLAIALAGCGTPSQPSNMTVSGSDALRIRGWLPDALRGQVAVAAVRGGQATSRWWGSQVSAAALQQALDESCRAAGLTPVAAEPAPRFELQAELAALEQPTVPLGAAAVGAAVNYTLLDRASGKVAYQRRIATRDEADLGEAVLSPSERLRIAGERALHGNIDQLLRDLVTLRP